MKTLEEIEYLYYLAGCAAAAAADAYAAAAAASVVADAYAAAAASVVVAYDATAAANDAARRGYKIGRWGE